MPCWWAGARGARNEEQCCEKHASLEKVVSAQRSVILEMRTALQKLQADMIAAHKVSMREGVRCREEHAECNVRRAFASARAYTRVACGVTDASMHEMQEMEQRMQSTLAQER